MEEIRIRLITKTEKNEINAMRMLVTLTALDQASDRE